MIYIPGVYKVKKFKKQSELAGTYTGRIWKLISLLGKNLNREIQDEV